MALKAWISLLRFPNLFIIFGCQHLIFHLILKPHLPFGSDSLSIGGLSLLSLNTVLIAAGGFVINNIFDSKLDASVPDKNPIPRYFKLKTAWILYILITISGLALTLWLALKTQRPEAIWINPSMTFILFLYSWKLKCMAVAGNVIVSMFTSAVILLIPFAYWPELNSLRALDFTLWVKLIYPFIMLALFAFLINFIREIVKDIEDFETDEIHQCHSTAVHFGMNNAFKLVKLFWVLFILILFSNVALNFRNDQIAYFILLMGLPTLILSVYIFKPLQKSHITFVSLGLKIFMLTGTLYWTLAK